MNDDFHMRAVNAAAKVWPRADLALSAGVRDTTRAPDLQDRA